MPVTPTYPGVYIEEIPSGVRTITGVATAITAFIGQAITGPVNEPVRIQSFAEFERAFGGLWINSAMSYSVQQYFLSGGSDAIVIRVIGTNAAKGAGTFGGLNLEAKSEGAWINDLIVTIDKRVADPTDNSLFNLTIKRIAQEEPELKTIDLEKFRNVSTNINNPRFLTKVLQQESSLVSVRANQELPTQVTEVEETAKVKFQGGSDGDTPTYADFLGSFGTQTGLYALEQADLFNLLCIPPNKRDTAVADNADGQDLLRKALAYCINRRAILIVDPPSSWNKPADVISGIDGLNLRSPNSAIYFPQILMPDALREFRLEAFPPSGVAAGIYARTDVQRGVWKAPAGIDAVLTGVSQLSYKMTDGENGQLNPLGINCLRSFPVYGNVAWGARTLAGADALASEWKYLPVRRLALFLEESLYRGTKWVVFEPNDEPLWSQIRLNIGAFMNNLFRQGAFQGKTPAEAYFVKCDKETTTQNDINLGIVNIVVGYAPLKPAEFVILKFQQMAGQIAT
jgi:uncharacterized protein